MVIRCYTCKLEKPAMEFSVDKRHKTGFQTTCKACNRAYQQAWYQANKERHLAKGKAYLEQNRDARREYEKVWYSENRDRYLSVCKSYRDRNREVVREKDRSRYAKEAYRYLSQSRKRESSQRQRTPVWYGEFDQFVFEEAYSLAKLRENATGIDWHVDHMLPLRSRKVSGLHVGLNAQVLPAEMNLAKCNKLLYTNPGEWVKDI